MNRQPQESLSSYPISDLHPPNRIFAGAHQQTLSLLAGFSIITFFAIIFYQRLLWPGSGVPWGSDTFGHIYRFTFLQESIRQGDWFPNVVPQWYLGIQLFRYYPPLVYYPLAALNALLDNPVLTANLFIVAAAWFGGVTWLLYRRWIGIWPAVIGGCLYMTLPDLVRVAMSEGNLLRHFTSALVPLTFFLVLQLLKSQAKPTAYLTLVGLFGLLVLGHPMMAAIIAALSAVVILLAWATKAIDLRKSLTLLAVITLGILSAAFWLLPSLTGGITELSAEAVIAGLDVVSLPQLVNPATRSANIESLYLGLGLFAVSLAAFFLSLKKRDEVFILSLTGLLGSLLVTPVLNPLYNAFPLASLMWPARFLSPTSFLLLLAVMWSFSRMSRKWVPALMLIPLLLDGWGSISLIHLNPSDGELQNFTQAMAQIPGWREATLDQSRLGSAPSYFVSGTGGRDQIYGWGFQGAVTAELISSLNEALSMGNSAYLADRLSLLGVDDLILPTAFPLPYGLNEVLEEQGFSYITEGPRMQFFHRDGAPRAIQFGTNILAIGKGAQNYAYIFPQVVVGSSVYLEDYSADELSQFGMVILSGFKWSSISEAEALIRQVAASGTQVVVDLHNAQEDPVARSPRFLDVWGERVILPNEPLLAKTPSGSVELSPFEYQGELWFTITPQGLDEELITYDYLNSTAVIAGTKTIEGHQVLFIGANLAYHIIQSNDTASIDLLAETLRIPALQVSDYQTVPLANYQADSRGVQFTVEVDADSRLLIPISSFDGTRVQIDGLPVEHSNYYDLVIVSVPQGQHHVSITNQNPPIYTIGVVVSVLSILSLFVLLFFLGKKRHEN